MNDEERTHQVLYYADGKETLSEPMPEDDAERHARELDSLGFAVGSVMDVDSAKAYMQNRYGKTYRGVEIPDGLRDDGMSRRVYEAWKQGVDAALAVAVPLVDDFIDPGACSLDHHGYCQEHGWSGEDTCPNERAQEFIKEARGEG